MEVNYNGEWGTVSDDGWDDTDAGVVCRQLGFGSSGTGIESADFGQGSGSIWLDSESTLASCGHLGINAARFCDHTKDAGVRCTEGQGSILASYIALYSIIHIKVIIIKSHSKKLYRQRKWIYCQYNSIVVKKAKAIITFP